MRHSNIVALAHWHCGRDSMRMQPFTAHGNQPSTRRPFQCYAAQLGFIQRSNTKLYGGKDLKFLHHVRQRTYAGRSLVPPRQDRHRQAATGPTGSGEGTSTRVQDTPQNQIEADPSAPSYLNGHNGATPSTSSSPIASTNTDIQYAPTGSRFAHRWRIVAMMAVAFVLCNMDKVRQQGRDAGS